MSDTHEDLPEGYQNDPAPSTLTGSFRVLEVFDDRASDAVARHTRECLTRALQDYPELAGETVTVACRQEWDDKLGRADMLNRIVYLPTDHATSFITLYHELAHLAVQVRDERGEDVPPSSEEYAGLLGVSRMPPERIDEDRVPYFGEPDLSKDEWPGVCQDALEYREKHHAYIKQAQQWLRVTGDA